MKEAEIDALGKCQSGSSPVGMQNDNHGSGSDIVKESSPDSYDQVMFTQNVETIETFSSSMVLVKVGRAYTGECINIMLQALWTEDSSLLQGLTVQNTCTELRQGSKKAVVGIRNSMAYPQTLQNKTLMAREFVVLLVPKPPMEVQLLEGGDEPQDPHTPKLTVRQRHGKLFDELDLSGLDTWPLGLADATCCLLAEYHNVFLFDPAELGCTHSTEHTIKLTDDTPFKE